MLPRVLTRDDQVTKIFVRGLICKISKDYSFSSGIQTDIGGYNVIHTDNSIHAQPKGFMREQKYLLFLFHYSLFMGSSSCQQDDSCAAV